MEIISIAHFVLTIIVLIVSVSGFVKIMKNDLSHLQNDVTEIKDKIETHTQDITSIKVDVAHLKGKFCKNDK